MFIGNTTVANVGAANTLLLNTLLVRSKAMLHPVICHVGKPTTRLVEPYTFLGAPPPLGAFNGNMKAASVISFKRNVPNQLWKNWSRPKRSDVEGDQIGAFPAFLAAHGQRVVEFQDWLLMKRLMQGSTANSQYITFDDGQTYTITDDAQPWFSASHSYDGGATSQSNIISGNLPATKALFLAQDPITTAKNLIADLDGVIDAFQTFKDNQGQPIFPTLDCKENVVVFGPAFMAPAFQLAFRTPGSLISTTTNVNPSFVKDVRTTGMLSGLYDFMAEATISPTNACDYYVFVVSDVVKPAMVQTYVPPKNNEMFPLNSGYDPMDEITKLMGNEELRKLGLTPNLAALYAGTTIDHNLNAVGSNAQPSTIQQEVFDISARLRGNVVPGPWHLAVKVKPYGGS